MTDWAEPSNFKEWGKRMFALRPLLIFTLICAVFILELRFDWVERFLGSYLVTTNSARPESGSIWEKSHQARTAQQALEQILTDRQSLQREARNATSFTQIATKVTSENGVMLSADQFRQLYMRLAPSIAEDIISPLDLLVLVSKGRWHRTYFEKAGNGVAVYLLDANNRVLRQLDLSSRLLSQLERGEVAMAESLDELPNFKNRIYTADQFFQSLESFHEEARRSMLPHPELLIAAPGQIVRVGISDETQSGFIELGFEFFDGSQRRVLVVQGQEWAVWRLRAHLEGLDRDQSTAPSAKPKAHRTR
jgi:hypothetical protein